MSINSKARRDAKKKKQSKPRVQISKPEIRAHATLHDGDGNMLGGVGSDGKEWIFVLNGQVVAGTNSAAMTMAMLRHTASVRESQGLEVRLSYSTELRAAATKEAESEGKSLEDYLDVLEAERAERDLNKQAIVGEQPIE
jgi:hypothetical protein